MLRYMMLFLVVCSINTVAKGDLIEDFDDITTLPVKGWSQQNLSNPIGITDWFQGNSGVFGSQAGAPEAYIAANFENAGIDVEVPSTISNWLITPVLQLNNGDTLSFYTRTEPSIEVFFPDRLEVRLSTSGASTNVGGTETSVGDFTTLLLSINPTLAANGYPDDWTQFNVVISGLAGPTSGRLAFRYFVTDGGPLGDNSNYIGIDTVRLTSNATAAEVPEPASIALWGLVSVAGFAAWRRKQRAAAT